MINYKAMAGCCYVQKNKLIFKDYLVKLKDILQNFVELQFRKFPHIFFFCRLSRPEIK